MDEVVHQIGKILQNEKVFCEKVFQTGIYIKNGWSMLVEAFCYQLSWLYCLTTEIGSC